MNAILISYSNISNRYGFSFLSLLTVLLVHGCGIIGLSGKWGYIDRSGNWVIPPRYDSPPGQFHSGRAPVHTGRGWRFIDRNGRYLLELRLSKERKLPISRPICNPKTWSKICRCTFRSIPDSTRGCV